MELWDTYDALGHVTGGVIRRGEPIPAGVYHVVAEIAVRHADGSVLVTQRDWNKPIFPGRWEMGAGGSVIRGETPLAGARRELWEETGLVADPLVPIFWAVNPKSGGIYAGYQGMYSGPKDAVRLQEGETIDYRWLSPRELLDFVQAPEFIVSHRLRWRVFLHGLEREASRVLLL